METVLTMMLIRFGVIALVVVVLALAAFAVVLVLRRSGRADDARRGAVSLARTVSRHVDGEASGVRGRAAGSVARAVADRLDRPAGKQDPGSQAGGPR